MNGINEALTQGTLAGVLGIVWWMFSTVLTVGFCCAAWLMARYRRHRTLAETALAMVGWFGLAGLLGLAVTIGGEVLIFMGVSGGVTLTHA